jgi:uncharacterized DUF497 family protein
MAVMTEVVTHWNAEKSKELRARHGVGFEEVALAIEKKQVIANIASPSKAYPHQRMLVIMVEGYTHAVPFIEKDGVRFLKTIFPSRVLHKKYGGQDHGPE